MIERIITAILAEQDSVKGGLVQGMSPDYASYREAVGRLRGLEDALRVIEALQEDETNERIRY